MAKKQQVHLVCLHIDCSSTPGAVTYEVDCAFTDEDEAKKRCDELQKALDKELMEDYDCETEEDLEDLYDIEYMGFTLSGLPFYSVTTVDLK